MENSPKNILVLVSKALNGNSLIFAHQSTLNNGKPVGYSDASLDVRDEARWGPHKALGSLLFKVKGWTNIKEFPFRAFEPSVSFASVHTVKKNS